VPNPALTELLIDEVTRRRYTAEIVNGQTTRTHEDTEGIRCRIQVKRAGAERKGLGLVPDAELLVTLDPDTDVRGPDDQARTLGDELLVTSGKYLGRWLAVRWVHEHAHLPHRKAEAAFLPAPSAG